MRRRPSGNRPLVIGCTTNWSKWVVHLECLPALLMFQPLQLLTCNPILVTSLSDFSISDDNFAYTCSVYEYAWQSPNEITWVKACPSLSFFSGMGRKCQRCGRGRETYLRDLFLSRPCKVRGGCLPALPNSPNGQELHETTEALPTNKSWQVADNIDK